MSKALNRLVERVRAAQASKTALAIHGAGTKAFYGEAIQGERLDLRELAGISSYEPSELVITARAGTPLAEVEAALAERGQCLPFEPPRFPDPEQPGVRGGTVGGMVAAGLAGPARAAVGSVRDFVLGATLLTGRAEVLSFGGQVIKNVAGYDVARLLPGSLGVLGVICEVSLKVLPVAPATRTLRFDCAEADALERLQRWGGQPLPLHASAWWQGALVVRLSGAAAAVESATRQMGGDAIDPALAQGFWNGMRDQTDEFFNAARKALMQGAALWRLSLPAGADPVGLSGEQLIEWGGAQRWWVTRESAERVRALAAAAGGHATLYRAKDKAAVLGVAQASRTVFAPLQAPLDRIHRELKTSFDPDGLFNPGRLYPGL